ncbi:hypothetical protein ASPTUDRAFT_168021 [Aspergillus tubingensis CBS 134.48]|uniref:Uncharacterized protein n=1 Tax=Aspergillus tubingensis (strain CBS 134.48) TaxID=767770 RepID=A0A1L9N6Z6_ASPTC|nr:hypothetical protein ASPTUDRAFT_168021 [Aspergillus tubingensis CBS 134.48]
MFNCFFITRNVGRCVGDAVRLANPDRKWGKHQLAFETGGPIGGALGPREPEKSGSKAIPSIHLHLSFLRLPALLFPHRSCLVLSSLFYFPSLLLLFSFSLPLLSFLVGSTIFWERL